MKMIKPHGGHLINQVLDGKERKKVLSLRLPRIEVIDDFILDIEQIAIGAYSPLKGFMNKDDLKNVIEKMRLSDGTCWTIPIFLPVDDKRAKSLSTGDKVIISDKNGIDIALIKIEDIYSYPKQKWAKKVYGTTSRKHPGVNRLYNMPDKFLGGEIWLINRARFKFHNYNLDPKGTRRIIKAMKWKAVAGFQTRNVPHRAHEYLQKLALTLTDGLLIHPIIGWKKRGDFNTSAIIKSYKSLIKYYYPEDSVIFSGLATAMRYAGPREAVFHAIIRKNYGCTHFIVGRDHAGVGGFYGKYDAHRIFKHFPDIDITPLLLRGPYYCTRCRAVVSDKICPHGKKLQKEISGTLLRERLKRGKDVPEYIIRREVYEVLRKSKKENFI